MASTLHTNLGYCSRLPISTPTSKNYQAHVEPVLSFGTHITLKRQAGIADGLQRMCERAGANHSLPLLRNKAIKLHSGSLGSARRHGIQAQFVEFNAKQSINIPFREGGVPAVDYLDQPERLVKVTFPDSARISYMGNSVWRTRLKPVTFFMISATPVCDLKVYNQRKTLRIGSDHLVLELTGLPQDFINRSIKFRLGGQLQIDAEQGSQYKAGRQVRFNGAVSINLKVNLPPPLSFIPDSLLTPVGDGILGTILGAFKSALLRGIIADYHSWSQVEQQVETKSRAVPLTGSK